MTKMIEKMAGAASEALKAMTGGGRRRTKHQLPGWTAKRS